MGDTAGKLYGPDRYVDAHIHLWENRTDWYSMPSGKDMGATEGRELPKTYGLQDYFASTAGPKIIKVVHVSALVQRPGYALDETKWLDNMAVESNFPNGAIGTLDTGRDLRGITEQLDEQMSCKVFRGIRLLGGLDYDSAFGRGVLKALVDRSLVYEVVAHPGTIDRATEAAERFASLNFVMEHTGWPLATDEDHFQLWRSEISRFATLPNTYCKLSGLAMTYHAYQTDQFRRFYEHCMDAFTPARCIYGSNFPVDGLYGTYSDLFAGFVSISSHLSVHELSCIFGETADKVYRI